MTEALQGILISAVAEPGPLSFNAFCFLMEWARHNIHRWEPSEDGCEHEEASAMLDPYATEVWSDCIRAEPDSIEGYVVRLCDECATKWADDV